MEIINKIRKPSGVQHQLHISESKNDKIQQSNLIAVAQKQDFVVATQSRKTQYWKKILKKMKNQNSKIDKNCESIFILVNEIAFYFIQNNY